MLELKSKLNGYKKLKVYLDTSVISYLMQIDVPDKMGKTLTLWEEFKIGNYKVCLSDVTIAEINKCDPKKLEYCNQKLGEIEYEKLEVTDAVFDLVDEIVRAGILPEKSLEDCQHIALAVLNKCDIIISWNFKHLVNIRTIQGIRKITQLKGYDDIEILTPATLLDMEV